MSSIPGLKNQIYFSFGISLISRLSIYGIRDSEAIAKAKAEELYLYSQGRTAQVFFSLRNLKRFVDERFLKNISVAVKRMEKSPHDMWEKSLSSAGFLGPLYFLLLCFSPYFVIVLNQGRVFNDVNPWERAKYMNADEQLSTLYKEIKEFRITSLDPLDRKVLQSTIES